MFWSFGQQNIFDVSVTFGHNSSTFLKSRACWRQHDVFLPSSPALSQMSEMHLRRSTESYLCFRLLRLRSRAPVCFLFHFYRRICELSETCQTGRHSTASFCLFSPLHFIVLLWKLGDPAVVWQSPSCLKCLSSSLCCNVKHRFLV